MTDRGRGVSVAQARADAERQQSAVRLRRRAAMLEHTSDPADGRGVVLADMFGTVVFVVAALPAVVAYRPLGESWIAWPMAFTSLGLFALGLVLFVVALVAGARRSRTDLLGIGGWFFLVGSAPVRVQRPLLGCLAVQVVGGLTAAAVRPFTALAFTTLVPTFGLALCGWWGARWGWFPPRTPERA